MKYRFEKAYILFMSLIVIMISILLVILPKKELSKTERRRLSTIPNVSVENLVKGKLLKDFDIYIKDHFPFRDILRNHKFKYDIYVMRKLQSGGYIYSQNHFSKVNLNVKEDAYKKSAKYFNNVLEKFFSDNKRYHVIIPTKNYYFKDPIYSNYEMVKDVFNKELINSKMIDISGKLDLESYYKSDLHWDVINIKYVADFILKNLNQKIPFVKEKIIDIGRFFGSYSSALADKSIFDKLKYIDSEELGNYAVEDIITKEKIEMFNSKEINSIDPYNVFLGGPRSLIEIKSKDYVNHKTLFLLRDSFASSLAPRFLGGYDRIVMIDLRYISPKILGKYIDVRKEDDVLLMISDEIVKDVQIFKK